MEKVKLGAREFETVVEVAETVVPVEIVDFIPKTNGRFIILTEVTAVVVVAESCSPTCDDFPSEGKADANEQVVATTGSVVTTTVVMKAVPEETVTGSAAFDDGSVTSGTVTEGAIGGDVDVEEGVMSRRLDVVVLAPKIKPTSRDN